MYYAKDKYAYAREYVLVLPDDTIYFKKDTPAEVKIRFEKEWKEHVIKRNKRHEQGDFTSYID